jgi:hypothetical protein
MGQGGTGQGVGARDKSDQDRGIFENINVN